MLLDDRLLPEFKKRLDEMGNEIQRPELLGYSRQARLTNQVAVKVTELLRVTARNMSIPLPLEPESPAERIAREEDEASLARLDAAIFAANPTLFGSITPN